MCTDGTLLLTMNMALSTLLQIADKIDFGRQARELKLSLEMIKEK